MMSSHVVNARTYGDRSVHTSVSGRSTEGHASAITFCSWHPTRDLLASGSNDSTARIWNVNNETRIQSVVLDHDVQNDRNIFSNTLPLEVASLDWNSDGQLLVTASNDGYIRIWNVDGQLVETLGQRKGRLIAVKWNKLGNYIVSSGYALTGYVWHAGSGRVNKRFAGHSEPVLDVDWRSNMNSICTFASCSMDKSIKVYTLRSNRPFKSFQGHTDDVNSIRWDPQGTLFASGSDDMSVKIWNMNQDDCIRDLMGHRAEVFAVRWSPTGPGTTNPNAPLVLASASFDSTVCIWDVDRGECIHKLVQHFKHVFSVAFSPDGKYLASGGVDNCLNIWNVANGTLIYSYECDDAIYEVCWNHRGDKIGTGDVGGSMYVFDIRKLARPLRLGCRTLI